MIRLSGSDITRIEEALTRMNHNSVTYEVSDDSTRRIYNRPHRIPRKLAIEEFISELDRILPERRA